VSRVSVQYVRIACSPKGAVSSKRKAEAVTEVPSKLKNSPCSKWQTVLRAALVASVFLRPRRYSEMNAGSLVEMGRAEGGAPCARQTTRVRALRVLSRAGGELSRRACDPDDVRVVLGMLPLPGVASLLSSVKLKARR
jgi:hypothetical protein